MEPGRSDREVYPAALSLKVVAPAHFRSSLPNLGLQVKRARPTMRFRPSSTSPLQLSSIPLQTSGEGSPGTQVCGTPPTQVSTVRRQAPMPQVVVPSPSSTTPLQ